MGYVRGEALSARMKRGIAVPAARRILVELADALDHAHRQGVVHRDVKPDNVLIDDESGRVMLTDFGIARGAEGQQGLTSTGSVLGTPHYMSPEQASGQVKLDGRSDIYSLGVIGYAMLAGRLPFDAPTVADVLVQHMTKAPPPLAVSARGVPDALAAVVMRCLAKEPEQRWPHARALKEALVATDATEDLPEPLREIEGDGLLLIGATAVAAVFEFVQWLWHGRLHQIPPQGLVAAVVLAIGGLTILRKALPVRRAGFGWARIAWSAFLEPSWWRTWYPRRLRRPDDHDIWARLPARIRLQRLAGPATIAGGLAGLAVALMFASPRFHEFGQWPALRALMMWPPPTGGVRAFPPLGLIACTIGWTLIYTAGDVLGWFNHRWLSRFGLPEHDRRGVIGGPLPRPAFWKREAIAAILRPASPDEVEAPRTPAEMMHRILSAADTVAARDATIASDAASAVLHLVGWIKEADSEIERLARDADPQERDRLRARLDALGTEAAGEPDERRRMRRLFQEQLSLLDELEGRLSAASSRREGRIELLKNLSLEMANLRAAAAHEVTFGGNTSARVKALCARIAVGHGEAGAAPTPPDDDKPTVAR